MPAKRLLQMFLVCCLLMSSLLACDLLPNTNISPSSATATATDQQNNLPMNQWVQVKPGVELRTEHWKSTGGDEDTVTIARFDLRHIHVSVGYQPDQPLSLNDWMKQTGAIAVINGGYFDKTNHATGLTISNGTVSGSSYPDYGGMLAVDANGTVSLRSLRQQPYDPNTEQLQQATQCTPMLMIDGKRTQFDANSSTQRRSVVAMDTQGHLLLIVSPSIAFSLDELADLLASSDLSLQTALNLDGGASTGLYVNGATRKVSIDSVTTLPIVIAIK